MTKKKYYVLQQKDKSEIFTSWDDCRTAIEHQGGKCRGFGTREEAEAFQNGRLSQKDIISENFDGVIAYVDGSFELTIGRYSFGCVLIEPDGTLTERFGSGDRQESAALRNVTGEMLGAMFAVKWAMTRGYQSIDIRYDYEGIEKWAVGDWKARTELTSKYAAAMKEWQNRIKISFKKIKAHTGNLYNEKADRLAKKALTEPVGIPGISE